jgi:hypothetical protein
MLIYARVGMVNSDLSLSPPWNGVFKLPDEILLEIYTYLEGDHKLLHDIAKACVHF